MSQQALLLQAIAKAGSGRALAQLLDRAETRISLWKSGREPIPDEVLAFLGAYTGEDPIQTLARERGGLWRKLTAASVALVLLAPITSNDAAARALPHIDRGSLCVMSNRLRAILRRLYASSLLRRRTIEPQLGQRLTSRSWPTTRSTASA